MNRLLAKKWIIISCMGILLIPFGASAQNLLGDWYGTLEVQGMKLRIVFHIQKDSGTYKTTMDSPDQGAKGIACSATKVEGNQLEIALDKIKMRYAGQFTGGVIKGTFSQSGMEFPMVLSREAGEEEVIRRPQEPAGPLPYSAEQVYFVNKSAGGIKLAGTLTIPKGVEHPKVVVLISGSGPQNRDEEVKAFHHRPFLVWSDYLTRQGIAVLRFDDRGVGESEGSQEGATSADFATDVESAVSYLRTRKDIGFSQIGLMGHSEGGLIAPMVAAKDQGIGFMVLLAGPGVAGDVVLRSQSNRIGELSGGTKDVLEYNDRLRAKLYELVKTEPDTGLLKNKIQEYLLSLRTNPNDQHAKEITDKMIETQVHALCSPWLNYFIRTNPIDYLSKVHCPVLALNGDKDSQVLSEMNLKGIKKGLQLAGNNHFRIEEMKDLNHLFQTCKTGGLEEYGKIEETVSPKAMELVADWIVNGRG